MDDSDQPIKCKVCNGRGYTHCDCWPGDCICGWDDEECIACYGEGYFYPEDDDFWDEHTPSPSER